MAEIIRNRTIRPSTRLETSKSYKIDTKTILSCDTLVVNIDHETKPFKESFHFKGSDVANRDSISFRVNDFGTHIDISWSGAQPIINSATTPAKHQARTNTQTQPRPVIKAPTSNHSKKSFAPLAADDIEILILGSMPGDKSLECGEYYAHFRNRFWKIIAEITNEQVPATYADKQELLERHKIGLWDVAEMANRKGSLDSDILDSTPNDLDGFLQTHDEVKVIAFNGTKAQSLFAMFFRRNPKITYFALPSTSSANSRITFDEICKQWRHIFLK